MAAKFFVVVCAFLALVNTIASCPCGSSVWAPAYSSWPTGAIGGCGCNTVAVDNGGALGVTSASSLAPSGISVLSENNIEGCVDVAGALPLLAAVKFEGNLPTAGSAGTSYCCGNGNIGISSESLAAAGIRSGAGAYGPGRIGLGAGRLGGAGCGCGCGSIYY